MNNKLIKLFAAAFALICVSTVGFAQDRRDRAVSAVSNLYVISAKAGAVNYVSGTVNIASSEKKVGTLQKGDTVEVGDIVSSSADGKAEVLLNPGSYIRIGENSSFEFVSTSLDDLQIKMHKGSAMLEVIADRDFRISLRMPNSKFYLISSGVFRIDVFENGDGKISVWKGKAQVGDVNATIVKGGRSATQNGTAVTVEKFKKDDNGTLEAWSKNRAKEIAKLNAKLMDREMNRSLINSFNTNRNGFANGYGFWVQDPFSRSYCFLPFGWGFSSPYGFGYNQSISNYYLTPQINQMIYQNPNLNNPNGGSAVNPSYVPSSGGGNPIVGNPGGGNGGTGGGSPSVSQPPRQRDPETARPGIVERKNQPIDN